LACWPSSPTASRQSISRLTSGTRLTRQAVTKHLRVLEAAGVVRASRSGRESRLALQPKAIMDAQTYLEHVSRQWDTALVRLKALVRGRVDLIDRAHRQSLTFRSPPYRRPAGNTYVDLSRHDHGGDQT